MMNERIRALALQAGFDVKRLLAPHPGGFPRDDFLALESFAELIVAECTAALFNESERLSGLYSEEDNWNSAEEYEIRSNQCIDDIALIEKHFGVEE